LQSFSTPIRAEVAWRDRRFSVFGFQFSANIIHNAAMSELEYHGYTRQVVTGNSLAEREPTFKTAGFLCWPSYVSLSRSGNWRGT
jgi:hypothetical protein